MGKANHRKCLANDSNDSSSRSFFGRIIKLTSLIELIQYKLVVITLPMEFTGRSRVVYANNPAQPTDEIPPRSQGFSRGRTPGKIQITILCEGKIAKLYHSSRQEENLTNNRFQSKATA